MSISALNPSSVGISSTAGVSPDRASPLGQSASDAGVGTTLVANLFSADRPAWPQPMRPENDPIYRDLQAQYRAWDSEFQAAFSAWYPAALVGDRQGMIGPEARMATASNMMGSLNAQMSARLNELFAQQTPMV
jgi:hypothetical protein